MSATAQVYEFDVEMTCEGCSNAVKRVLGKLEGKVSSIEIDLKNKKVAVESTMSSNDLLEVLKKTGKTVSFVGLKTVK